MTLYKRRTAARDEFYPARFYNARFFTPSSAFKCKAERAVKVRTLYENLFILTEKCAFLF